MVSQVTVVDYGVGNLYSVRRALEFSGCQDVLVSARPEDIRAARRLILPGVGAFEDGMRGLCERDLIEPLLGYARSGKPLLGICLGMQMLATTSEEFGRHEGLGLIAGKVTAIPRRTAQGSALKVPSIGWTTIDVTDIANARGCCLDGHDPAAEVYLVHSFHVQPDDRSHLLSTYRFGGHAITAAIRKDNVTGLQFHPEKSGAAGLAIMRKFVGST